MMPCLPPLSGHSTRYKQGAVGGWQNKTGSQNRTGKGGIERNRRGGGVCVRMKFGGLVLGWNRLVIVGDRILSHIPGNRGLSKRLILR